MDWKNLTPEEFIRLRDSGQLDLAEPPRDDPPKRSQSELFNYHSMASQQPLILLDFDRTLCEFTWHGPESYNPFDLGLPLEGSQDFVRELFALAASQPQPRPTIGLWTQRFNYWTLGKPPRGLPHSAETLKHLLIDWLNQHGFPPGIHVYDEAPLPHVVYLSDSAVEVLPPDLTFPASRKSILYEVQSRLTSYRKDLR
jgi:hypothetical protein